MATVSEQIQEIYIGLLGRAADKEGLDYWAAEIEGSILTVEQLRANIVNEQTEYQEGLGAMTRAQTISALYDRLFERTTDSDGFEYWVNGGGATVNVDQLVVALSNGSSAADRLVLDNKTEAAEYYTNIYTIYDPADAKAAVDDVDGTILSVDTSKAATDALNNSTDPTYILTADASAANEGTTTTFTLATTGVTEGTNVAYTLTGVATADVDALTGIAEVTADGTATISVTLIADAMTEGEETLTVSIVGQTATASTTINDTSLTPNTSDFNVVAPDAANTAAAMDTADAITFADLTTGNFNVTDFNTTDDKLILTGLIGADGATLADLAGDTITTGVVGVQINEIAGSTFVNLGQDADGAVISIELAGVTDASLVVVELV